MKAMQNFNVGVSLFLILGAFFSCSDDDPQPGCFEGLNLKKEATITNINGTVRAPGNDLCEDEYVIDLDENVESSAIGLLLPCNLSEEFQVADAKVVFSGFVYEGINDGDQCADFFEITEIKFSNQ